MYYKWSVITRSFDDRATRSRINNVILILIKGICEGIRERTDEVERIEIDRWLLSKTGT